MKVLLGDDKPSLDQYYLEHYGVLGMKWGQRKKYTGAEIRTARKELRVQNKKYREEARKVNDLAEGSAARKAGEKKLEKLNREYLNNPARVAAVRMTRGEKFSSLLFASSGIGVGVSVAAIATSSIASRRIEAKQDAKAYKNVKGRRKAGGIGAPSGAMIGAGGALASGLLKTIGSRAMSSIAARAAANNSARLSSTRAIGSVASKLKYARKSRGAFKITTL